MALRASVVLTVAARADVDALSPLDRQQFAALGPELVGPAGATVDGFVAWLAREQMALHKIRLARDGAAVFDVWINAVMDDGVVFDADSAALTGIGISQTEVSDTTEDRDALCAEIQAALYAKEFDPPYVAFRKG